MLEAGLVRKRSVGTQLLKNIALYALAGIMFYLVGYNLMYTGVDGGWFGSFAVWAPDDGTDYAALVDGRQRLRERVGLVLPDGVRGDRGLDRLGRPRRAHPGLAVPAVHRRPDRAALSDHRRLAVGRRLAQRAGLLRLRRLDAGPFGRRLGGARRRAAARRRARASTARTARSTRCSARRCRSPRIGTFILWLGWFGFNGGSQLAMGSGADVDAIADDLRQHQPRGRRRRARRDDPVRDPLQEDRSDLRPQRRDRGPGLDHRRAADALARARGADRRGRRRDRGRRPCRCSTGSGSTTWSARSRRICSPASGARSRCRSAMATRASRCRRSASSRSALFTFLASLLVWAAIKATVGIRIPEEARGGRHRSGRARDGGLPRVRPRPGPLAHSFPSSPTRSGPAGARRLPGFFAWLKQLAGKC